MSNRDDNVLSRMWPSYFPDSEFQENGIVVVVKQYACFFEEAEGAELIENVTFSPFTCLPIHNKQPFCVVISDTGHISVSDTCCLCYSFVG